MWRIGCAHELHYLSAPIALYAWIMWRFWLDSVRWIETWYVQDGVASCQSDLLYLFEPITLHALDFCLLARIFPVTLSGQIHVPSVAHWFAVVRFLRLPNTPLLRVILFGFLKNFKNRGIVSEHSLALAETFPSLSRFSGSLSSARELHVWWVTAMCPLLTDPVTVQVSPLWDFGNLAGRFSWLARWIPLLLWPLIWSGLLVLSVCSYRVDNRSEYSIQCLRVIFCFTHSFEFCFDSNLCFWPINLVYFLLSVSLSFGLMAWIFSSCLSLSRVILSFTRSFPILSGAIVFLWSVLIFHSLIWCGLLTWFLGQILGLDQGYYNFCGLCKIVSIG